MSLYRWFYALDGAEVVFLIALAVVLFSWTRACWGARRWWKALAAVGTLIGVAAILYSTVGRQSGERLLVPQLVPFHSYRAVMAGANREILRSNFMNVVLFVPAGLFLCELLPESWRRWKRVVFVGACLCVLSVVIEGTQYRFALGQTEVDDVIHNTLGALIGAAACGLRLPVHKP